MDIASFLDDRMFEAIFSWTAKNASKRVKQRHEYVKRYLENL